MPVELVLNETQVKEMEYESRFPNEANKPTGNCKVVFKMPQPWGRHRLDKDIRVEVLKSKIFFEIKAFNPMIKAEKKQG